MIESGWSLREEVGEWVAKWYLFVLAFLIGGGVGWGAAFVFPADTEARAPLFVAFNSDALFTSPDDYQNAQFEEVTDLILADAVLDEVLAGLDEGDRSDLRDRDALRDRFSVQWRNAGRWDLVARDRDPARAGRLAALWREVAFGQIMGFITHAQSFYQLDLELNATTRAQGEVHRSQSRLQAVRQAVGEWLAHAGDEPVAGQERAELFALGVGFATPDSFPMEGAERQAYRNWAEGLMAALETENGLLDAQEQTLRGRMAEISVDWLAEKTASRGLSAFLVVELRGEVETEAVRKPGVVTLVGGLVGGLGWIVFRLVRVGKKRQK